MHRAFRRVAEIGRRFDVKTVGRAEGFGFHQHTVKNHRHGETEHGEENLAVARQQETGEEGGNCRECRGGCDQYEHVVHSAVAGDQGHCISANGVK